MSESNRQYIVELFKIVSTTNILIVDRNGILKRVFCPFKVIALVDMPPLHEGAIYKVEAIKMTIDLKEVYMIEGKGYYSRMFRIL